MNSWGVDFDKLAALALVLVAEAVHKGMERRLGARVGGHGHRRHNGQVCAGHNQRGGRLLLEEHGAELEGQVDDGGKVGVDFVVERIEVNLGGIGETNHALHAGVEQNTVQVGILFYNSVALLVRANGELLGVLPLNKSVEAVSVGNVIFDGAGLGSTVLLDEGVESVLTTANCDDFGALLDKFVGEAGADARGGANKENILVREAHFEGVVAYI